MTSRSLLCSVSLLVFAAVPAHAQEAPPGWDGYRFGMTLEEAAAVPGLSFEEGDKESRGSQKTLHSASDVEVGGTPFRVFLDFAVGEDFTEGWLSAIRLAWQRRDISEARCAQKHGEILERAGTRYGSLKRHEHRDTEHRFSRYSAFKQWWSKENGFKKFAIDTGWSEKPSDNKAQTCEITISYEGGQPPAKKPAAGGREF